MKLNRFILIAALIAMPITLLAQVTQKVIVATKDPHNMYWATGQDSSLLFYNKLVPKNKPVAALIILPGGGETLNDVMKQISLHKLAVEKDILVVLPSINWGTVKKDEEIKFLNTIFEQLVSDYQIAKDKFILGGFSGGGMLALTYAEQANSGSKTFLKPRAIFGVDPPVDYANLWKQCERDVERNFSEPAVSEGKWIMNEYRKEFGGSPQEVPENYVKYSIYSHNQKDGGNAKYLLKTPIRLYTEPGILWQLQNRHRDIYDLNCTDISAMINLLQSRGNKSAEMIVTHDKGKRLNGQIHPHSWSVMDSKDCLDWILKQLEM